MEFRKKITLRTLYACRGSYINACKPYYLASIPPKTSKGYFKMLVYTFIMFFQGNGNVHNKLTIVTDEPRHEK